MAAVTAATNMFNAEAANISGATVSAPTITLTNSGLVRTVTVSYTATSTNTFPNVFAMLTKSPATTWPISGSSTATSYSAPNINFYLLLDNSPSMDIAATTAGINTMVANYLELRAAAPSPAMKPIHRPTAWETRMAKTTTRWRKTWAW